MKFARIFVCVILLSTLAAGQGIATIEQPLVPTAAQPGGPSFTLTINGTGFATAPMGVMFGGTQLPIASSSPTQLTATVPMANIATAGTASVSVLSSDGLTSNVEFFQIATPATPQFAAPVDYNPLTTNQGTIESVLAADFNRDGILDLAVGVVAADAEISDVCILLGNANGTFQAPACHSVDNPSSMVAGIFNNDGGSLDIAVGDQLLVNNPPGVFTVQNTPVEGFVPYAVGDFSQTGVLDIAGVSGINVQILNNDGSGNFSAGQNFTGSTTQFGGMLAADFNGDGVLDLAVLDIYEMNPVVRVFLGNTETGFSGGNGIPTSTPVGVVAFTAADFNGDKNQDLALVSSPPAGGGEVSILNGNGDGTFTSGFTTPLANVVSGAIVTADFNEDGKLDLATGTYILQGNGDGTFQTPPIDFGGTSEVLATGDFNGDGRPDIAAQANPNVAILLQQAPVVSLTPTSLTFVSQTVGTTSASQSITLSNTGSAVLAIDSITITGTDASEFNQTNGCSASLAADSSCTINVTFAPTTAGNATASVSFTDDAAGSPQTVPLTGVGAEPVVSLSPTSLTFASQTIGTTSTSQQITLSNTGNAVLAIDSIAITGTNAGEFNLTNGCSASLAADSSCGITVTFTPTAAGNATGSVTVTDNAAGSPQTVSLTGVGAATGAPVVSLTPATLNFNGQAVGMSVMQQTTLTNTGTAVLDIDSIGITGANAEEFSQTNTCGETLAANANCTITVTFTPTTVGSATASISVNDNAAGSPQTVPLPAAGAPFSLTTTCTSLTVVPGQTAIFSVDLAAAGDFTPTVALSCSGAPALATCTPASSSMNLSGTTPVQIQVTATTTQATGFLHPPFGGANENRLAGLVGLGGIAGLAVLVILPGKHRGKSARSKNRQRLYGFIALICVLATLAMLPSCAGVSDPPGTASGTYPLTVTGTFQQPTGPAITETVTFNLVVQ